MLQGTVPATGGVIAAITRAGLFSSRCTISAPSGVLVDAGQPDGNYTNVPGLVDIPCTSAPLSDLRIEATEMKALEEIQALAPRHILLAGYFPTLEFGVDDGWQAVVDGGDPLDILGAESDSQKTMTRLQVRWSGV